MGKENRHRDEAKGGELAVKRGRDDRKDRKGALELGVKGESLKLEHNFNVIDFEVIN